MSRPISGSRLAVFVVAALAASSVKAQQSRGLPTLAAIEGVQVELGTIEETAIKLKELHEDFRSARSKSFAAVGIVQSPSPLSEEYAAFSAKAIDITTKLDEEFTPKLSKLLSADQLKRLHQIQVQELGHYALIHPTISARLSLTAEQMKKLDEIRADFLRDYRMILGAGDSARYADLKTTTERKTLEVLTGEQLTKFDDLKGPLFDLTKLRVSTRRGNREK